MLWSFSFPCRNLCSFDYLADLLIITIVGFHLERRFVNTTAIIATMVVVEEEKEVVVLCLAGKETKVEVKGNLNRSDEFSLTRASQEERKIPFIFKLR